MVDHDTADREYIDVKAIHPDYREAECWNCGHTRHVTGEWRVCHECFMGQQAVADEHRGEYETDEGYTNYGALWYGWDTPLDEMRRQYERTREEMSHLTRTDRVVRV